MGRPVVDGAVVSAEVLRQERGDKIVVFKYKPKARTRVKKGARAELTRLRIADIAFAGRSAAGDAQVSESRKAKAAREAEKAADREGCRRPGPRCQAGGRGGHGHDGGVRGRGGDRGPRPPPLEGTRSGCRRARRGEGRGAAAR